jgi:hypothetical protein
MMVTMRVMLLSGVIVLLSSVILYVKPHGWVAYWVDWQFWGLSLSQWKDIHMNLGFLFLLASIVHLFYNWASILTYLKNKTRKFRVFTLNFNLACGLVGLVAVGTYAVIPPMSLVVKLGESISTNVDKKYEAAPYVRAELSSLKFFARKVNLNLVKAKKLLQENGIRLKNDTQSLCDLAKAHNLTPAELYKIMLPAVVQKADGNCFPDTPPPGFGRKKLTDVCVEYKLNLPAVVLALGRKGIKVDQTKTILSMARENDVNPMVVFEIIHGMASGSEF